MAISASTYGEKETIFTGHSVTLDCFEGPLDLLLFLVKRNEIEITEVSIASIADQYLEYIYVMSVLDVEVAGEFLVVAATLMLMKSRFLLPRIEEGEEEEESEEIRELVERLREYSKYRESAERLWERYERHRLMFSRGMGEGGDGNMLDLGDVSVFELAEAFRSLLERSGSERPHEISRPRITVESQARSILATLQQNGASLSLRELVGPNPTKMVIIVCFLALLELIKARKVRAVQAGAYGEIRIKLASSRVSGEARD